MPMISWNSGGNGITNTQNYEKIPVLCKLRDDIHDKPSST